MKKSAKVLLYFGLDCGMMEFFTYKPQSQEQFLTLPHFWSTVRRKRLRFTLRADPIWPDGTFKRNLKEKSVMNGTRGSLDSVKFFMPTYHTVLWRTTVHWLGGFWADERGDHLVVQDETTFTLQGLKLPSNFFAFILYPTKYIYRYHLENHSVCPLVGIGPPHPLSRKRLRSPPPPNQRGGGGVHTCLRPRGWGSPSSDDWRERLVLCLLCALSVISPCLQ